MLTQQTSGQPCSPSPAQPLQFSPLVGKVRVVTTGNTGDAARPPSAATAGAGRGAGAAPRGKWCDATDKACRSQTSMALCLACTPLTAPTWRLQSRCTTRSPSNRRARQVRISPARSPAPLLTSRWHSTKRGGNGSPCKTSDGVSALCAQDALLAAPSTALAIQWLKGFWYCCIDCSGGHQGRAHWHRPQPVPDNSRLVIVVTPSYPQMTPWHSNRVPYSG